ncbi:MAG: HAD hydrolase-like protein [Candidatus Thalassarchaeaceae archaeon]|nr:HAD hydrolase-like protein [Candidatus Thalassarchaeaceae archaeon]
MGAEGTLLERLDLVVFDLVGTTVIIGNQIPEAFAGAFQEHGIILSEWEILEIRGRSKREAISILLEKHVSPPSTSMGDSVFESFQMLLQRMLRNGVAEAIPGSEDTFLWLRERGIRIALNTGLETILTMQLLEQMGWVSTVDAVVCGDQVPTGRPAPDLIIESMRRLDCRNPSRVVALGDTRADLEAARSAGVGLVVGVLSGAHDSEQLKALPSDVIIPSVADLPRLLSLKNRP